MIEVTSAQLDKIGMLIKEALPSEHQVEFAVSVRDEYLGVNVFTRVDSVSVLGELPQETLVRTVCWLAVRTVVSKIEWSSVIINTNDLPRPPSPAEMAFSNALEVWLRKANRKRQAVTTFAPRPVHLNHDYR